MKINNARLQFKGVLKNRTLTDYIVIHHADAVKCDVNDIHKWHLNNGWAGIGYHLFIRKDGSVWQGRPIDTIGAQAEGVNSKSVGICVEGNYDQEPIMPEAQSKSLKEVLQFLKGLYPKAKIVGHKEVTPTSCPGKFFDLDTYKKIEVPTLTFEQILNEWSALGIINSPETWKQICKTGAPIDGFLIKALIEKVGNFEKSKGVI